MLALGRRTRWCSWTSGNHSERKTFYLKANDLKIYPRQLNTLWPSDAIDLRKHWFKWQLVAREQAITWSNVDFPPKVSFGIRLKAVSVHLTQDDVIKWKHFPRNWPFVRGIHRSPVNSPHKGQWRGALMFTLICARINSWVNTREAGDLRRYRPHYDVIVMVNVCSNIILLTPQQLERHGCAFSTVATDALMLKHPAVSIHNADQISIALDQFLKQIPYL